MEVEQFIDQYLWYILAIVVWDSVWKVMALWKSARNDQLGWFITLAVINSVGILPIAYIYFIGHKKSTT